MQHPGSSWWRRLLVVPPILLGVAVLAFFVINRRQAPQEPVQEVARTLRVVEVPAVDVVPRVRGYGIAKPGKVWRAVARVKGHVVAVHPKLEPGALLEAGEELLQIDPTEYKLTVAQLDADIQQTRAQLTEMAARGDNYRASLKIEQDTEELALREVNRLRDLARRNAASGTDLDRAEQTYLGQKQKVQSIKNSLNTLPAEKSALEAGLLLKQSKLEQAKIDLDNTSIKAPFACRVGDVEIEKGQYLALGEQLFEAHGIDRAEIDVQVPLDKARTLVQQTDLPAESGIPDFDTLMARLKLEATVHLHVGDYTVSWQGRPVGVRERLDSQARTLSFVIAVDRPYAQVVPGQRPPLIKGTFTEVEIRSRPLKGQLVVPRSAYRAGAVYLVNEQNRLERHPVKVLFAQSTFLIVENGLKPGARLVVSDPTPAIEGMLVDPVPDAEVQKRLVDDATGKGELE